VDGFLLVGRRIGSPVASGGEGPRSTLLDEGGDESGSPDSWRFRFTPSKLQASDRLGSIVGWTGFEPTKVPGLQRFRLFLQLAFGHQTDALPWHLVTVPGHGLDGTACGNILVVWL